MDNSQSFESTAAFKVSSNGVCERKEENSWQDCFGSRQMQGMATFPLCDVPAVAFIGQARPLQEALPPKHNEQ